MTHFTNLIPLAPTVYFHQICTRGNRLVDRGRPAGQSAGRPVRRSTGWSTGRATVC
ncbi:hypothetical protein CsSME_00005817 [Camellia sinensis var. sinensis]